MRDNEPMTFVGTAIRGNRLLWGKGFGAAWNRISLTEKCVWIFFLMNTVALVTIAEILLFRK